MILGPNDLLGILILAFLVMVPLCFAVLALLDIAKVRLIGSRRRWWLVRAAIISNTILALCAVDAWLIEPRVLTVTRLSATSPKVSTGTGMLKVVQVSDLHFARHTKLTAMVLGKIAEQKPDLIFATGDMFRRTGFDDRQFGEFMKRLASIAPTYLVVGYRQSPVLQLASNGHATLLGRSEAITSVRGTGIRIRQAGSYEGLMSMKPDPHHLVFLLSRSPDCYLGHMRRDVIPEADWALAGDTDGVQICLPFWGRVVSGCDSGKKWEYGEYSLGQCKLFVSRGIGLEPRAPQVRFLCPPEIVVLTVASGCKID